MGPMQNLQYVVFLRHSFGFSPLRFASSHIDKCVSDWNSAKQLETVRLFVSGLSVVEINLQCHTQLFPTAYSSNATSCTESILHLSR